MSNRLKSLDPERPAKVYHFVNKATGEVEYVGCTTQTLASYRASHKRFDAERHTWKIVARGPLSEMRKREIADIAKYAPLLNVHHNPRYGLEGEQMLPDGWPRKNASTHPDAAKRREYTRARRARLKAAGLPLA